MPFFFQRPWPNFAHAGRSYSLAHLNEYVFEALDSEGIQRKILVTFSDHCFTKDPELGDDPRLHYPPSTRGPGHFCVDRWDLSLSLRDRIQEAAQSGVWLAQDARYGIIPTIHLHGRHHLYGILFELSKVKGFHFKLKMDIITAYPLTRLTEDGESVEMATFGEIKFDRLVKLRLNNQIPVKNADRHRRKPRVYPAETK